MSPLAVAGTVLVGAALLVGVALAAVLWHEWALLNKEEAR